MEGSTEGFGTAPAFNQMIRVPFMQGQPELLSEDDSGGLNYNQLARCANGEKMHFLTHGKRYFSEDENSGLCSEGRNKSGGELMGFGMDFGYQQSLRKLQQWSTGEDLMFPPGKHGIVGVHRHCDSEGSQDREQSKKVDYGDLEAHSKTSREHSSGNCCQFDGCKRAFEFDFGRFGEKDFEIRHDGHGALGNGDSPVGVSQNILEENLISSLYLKPAAWALSPNLPSFSNHVGSSKELSSQLHGAPDGFGIKFLHDSPLKSTSLGICSGPDDESYQQKKPHKRPRLGWGQGLAKYEKQKVDGAEDNSDKSNLIQHMASACWKFEDVGHAIIAKEETRSPEATATASGFRSPQIPYPVTGICSPDEHSCYLEAGSSELGLYGKSCNKTLNTVRNRAHFIDDALLSQSSLQVYAYENIAGESRLVHLDGISFIPGNSQAVDALHRGVPSFGMPSSQSAGPMGRLLLFKHHLLQNLERIEYEIDTIEKELGFLNSETEREDFHSQRKVFLDASGDCSLEACMEVVEDGLDERFPRDFAGGPQVFSTVHLINGQILVHSLDSEAAVVGVPHESLNEQHIECQVVGTENSTAVMQAPVRQSSEEVEFDGIEYLAASTGDGAMESRLILAADPNSSSCLETNTGVTIQSSSMIGSPVWFTALAAGTDLAQEASGLFAMLLPTVGPDASRWLYSEISETSVWQRNALIHKRNKKQLEAKISEQRHFVNFKEKALALKFRVLKESWREELSCCLNSGHQSYHSLDRSQISSCACTSALFPSSEAGQMGMRSVSNVQVSPYGGILKMPAMILHDKERYFSRFSTSNGLVEDPIALEKERTMTNPWTSEEKELFWEKFIIFGKNFSVIASLLEHKTVADCVEFYYKNQKFKDLEKIERRCELKKQKDYSLASTYLSTSRNKLMSNATSLDVLGAAVALATGARDRTKSVQRVLEKCTDLVSGRMRSEVFVKPNKKGSSDADFLDTEKECTATAADVLAGICGASSCEAVHFCIDSAEDPSNSFHEKTCSRSFLKKKDDAKDQLITSNAHFEAHSSEEECHEENIDWTDDEKWLFMTAVSMFAKDFGSISGHVHSKTEDQCRTFFCKARKRLRLDELIQQESVVAAEKSRSDYNEGLIERHTNDRLLCNVDASGKTTENSKSKFLHAAKEKARAARDLVEAVEVCNMEEHGNNSSSKDDKHTLNQLVQLTGNVEESHGDQAMASEEASMHLEEQQHKEKKPVVMDMVSVDISANFASNGFKTTNCEFCEAVRLPPLNRDSLNNGTIGSASK